MRIIVPKGTPRANTNTTTSTTSTTTNTFNNNNLDPARTQDQPQEPILPPSYTNHLHNTTTRSTYGVRTSPPHDFSNNYGYGEGLPEGVAPRRRKQNKKHKSTSPNSSLHNTTASYYNNADLDDGYNSSDEHGGGPPKPSNSLQQQRQYTCGQGVLSEIENDLLFEEELKMKKGYYVKKTQEDGNCLFRAIADQIYGDEEMHGSVRKLCMDYMEKERDHFSQFVTEDFESYVARKRQDKCFGNNIEMQALSEVYCRPIEVYHGRNLTPLNIFHGTYNTDYPPIRLSYHHGNHYNSIVDPNNPSVGVGLGLPSYQPGHADKMQVMEAMRLSEQDDIEKALLESSRQSSEYQEIEREIEEAVLAASRAEYIASLFASVPIPPNNTTTTTNPNRNNNRNNMYNNNNFHNYPTTTTTTTTTSSPSSPLTTSTSSTSTSSPTTSTTTSTAPSTSTTTTTSSFSENTGP